MRWPQILLVGAILLIGVHASAMAEQALPDFMKYKGKAIPPSCLVREGDSGNDSSVDLPRCVARAKEAGGVIKHNATFGAEDYTVLHEGARDCSGCFEAYRHIGNLGEWGVFYVSWSGGGSGIFSQVVALKREGKNLVFGKVYAAGDRCNGGVVRVEVTEKGVLVEQNVTPSDFYHMTQTKGQGPDLAGSAVACFGTKRSLDGELLAYIPPAPEDIAAPPASTAKLNPTQCFKQMMKQEPKQAEWTVEQLRNFMARFIEHCSSEPLKR